MAKAVQCQAHNKYTSCKFKATVHVESPYTRTSVHEVRSAVYFLCRKHAQQWIEDGTVNNPQPISAWEMSRMYENSVDEELLETYEEEKTEELATS